MADRKRTDLQFQVASVVNRLYPKLAYKYFSPFQVLERVGLVAYRLALPEGSKIHNVFMCHN
jgi:hypothetical protein